MAEAWEIFDSEVLLEPSDDRQGVLARLLERWLSFYEREVFAGGCLFVIAAVELADRQDVVSNALADVVELQMTALEAAVRSAIESGEIPPNRDPGRTAFALHSVLVNADSLFQVRQDKAVFDGARATIGELLAVPPGSGRSSSASP